MQCKNGNIANFVYLWNNSNVNYCSSCPSYYMECHIKINTGNVSSPSETNQSVPNADIHWYFKLHGLLNFSLNPVLNNNFHSPRVYSHLTPNKVLWLPDMFSCLTCLTNNFGQEIFSLDKFWFSGLIQNTFKPLVWYLLHQNILIIINFMKVYEKLIIFIKSLILNIFSWKKCLTIGLKVFWVDLWKENLSKINIS